MDTMFLPRAYGNEKLDPAATMNPMWAQWLDMVQGNAGTKQIKLRGGASAKGSTQMRGYSQQPDHVYDPREEPLGPQGFVGTNEDGMYATQRASLTGLQGLLRKKR